ncbi:MAG: DNA repair protein RecN [Actinomycetota bacterium]|nr:DNA repair protein RecN [Actinomycetota bacterium]
MIDELHITGLGVIEDTTLHLAPGLTVITGETGAGKTMLITALQLLLGARADATLVRKGVEAALVEARLAPVPPTAVADGWVHDGQDELVVSREILARDEGGRSRVRIGGRLAPVSALADLLGGWVEVHAQGEHVRLSQPETQRALLDRYAGGPHTSTFAAYQQTYRAWQEARLLLGDLSSAARERAREVDRLRHEISEIERAALTPNEDRLLREKLDRLEHAEELAVAASAASAALDEDGAGGPLGVAVGALRRHAGHDPVLDVLRERTEALAAETADLRSALRDYAETVESDPQQLDELHRRERQLADLQRKYGGDTAQVLSHAEEARDRLYRLEEQESKSSELERRVSDLFAQVERLSTELRRGRKRSGEHLAAAVGRHLAALALPRAAFSVRLEPTESAGPTGADRVTFELAANTGEPARPLSQAASGGERSRVALAVKAALAEVDEARVLVFDEVDAGVGGATALAVGEKLARLAQDGGPHGQGRQVLCVTHLAQLAAFADVHHVVEKKMRGERTVTTTRRVHDQQRAAELARMLSGSATRSGLEHAGDLLAEAAARRAQPVAR